MKARQRTFMAKRRLFICIDNAGYEASLELRKLYEGEHAAALAKRGLLRIVDESGESCMYPGPMFVEASLPTAARRAVLRAV